jgi:hypothetical protein
MPTSPPPQPTALAGDNVVGELLAEFTGPIRGFQAFSRASYRGHEEWRTTVFRELQQLEGDGLLVIRQLVPCSRHGKCQGQPVAAGCELTREGRRLRDQSAARARHS